MSCKFRDDLSNDSGVIVLTDRQTNTQTDAAENNSTLSTLRCAGGNNVSLSTGANVCRYC